MAKMGTRKLIRREPVGATSDERQIAAQPVNLVINPFQVQPVATVGLVPTDTGMSIMREGFITGTGFLIGSPNG
jgi:hypothetical protein